MRLTLEDLQKYSDSIAAPGVKVEFEAKMRIGPTLKRISKTSDLKAFIADVLKFKSNFPSVDIMISKTEIRS
jgi:hypothetical protein